MIPADRQVIPFQRDRSVTPASMHSSGLLSEIQAAIGQYLRSEYDLAQSIPAQLVDLLREVEQPSALGRHH
jgi:hypothetical protein